MRGRVFAGWYVVGGVFVMLTVSAGLGFYALAVYLRELTAEQGFSLPAVSGATAVFFLVAGVTGLPIASVMARYDPRPLVAAGAVTAGVALALLGRVEAVWQVYAVYALFGVGFAASGLVPGTTLVTRWFSRRRSVALSVASTGLSLGGVALTPVVARLLEREALVDVSLWLGVAYVVGIVPLTAVLLRPSPERMGLLPDGDVAVPGDPVRVRVGVPSRDAVRTRFFACVTLAHLLAMLAQVGGIAHVFNLVADRNDVGLAATALSLVAVCSLLGRLLGGWLAARTSMRGLAVVLMAGQGGALLALSVLDSPLGLLAATVVFGITVGNLLMLHPLLLAERFGVVDYGRIYSRSQLLATLGVAAGPAAIGMLHDLLDGYGAAFALAALASLAAAGVLAASGPTRVETA